VSVLRSSRRRSGLLVLVLVLLLLLLLLLWLSLTHRGVL
jgi:hypothetical protein